MIYKSDKYVNFNTHQKNSYVENMMKTVMKFVVLML